MCPFRYYDVMRESKDTTVLRYQMVLSVERWGLKATARDFHTSRNTVRKWHRRWKQEGYRGLREISRCPHRSPGGKLGPGSILRCRSLLFGNIAYTFFQQLRLAEI